MENSKILETLPLPPVSRRLKMEEGVQSFAERQYLTDDNPKFSILELMTVTGTIAGGIAAISQLGMIGTLILLFVTATISGILRAQLVDPTRLRFWNQFLWGVLMPIGCVFGDPFIFGRFDKGHAMEFSPFAIPAYAFMIWQMQLLVSSWFITPKHRRMNGFLGGTFLAGAAFAVLVAIGMLPFTIIGLLALIGVLGLIPWITAVVYFRTGKMHLRRSRNSAGRLPLFFVGAGFIGAAGLLIGLLILARIGLLDINFLIHNNQFDL